MMRWWFAMRRNFLSAGCAALVLLLTGCDSAPVTGTANTLEQSPSTRPGNTALDYELQELQSAGGIQPARTAQDNGGAAENQTEAQAKIQQLQDQIQMEYGVRNQ